MMKSLFSVRVLLVVLILSATFSGPLSAQARKARVAVMDFDYATVQSYSSAMFGSNVDVGKGVTDLLIAQLVKNGSYSIIERQALDKIMA
ncbi:MAG TPA: CsgG/HfaB family protein, partial [Terracidiphilus sp.]